MKTLCTGLFERFLAAIVTTLAAAAFAPACHAQAVAQPIDLRTEVRGMCGFTGAPTFYAATNVTPSNVTVTGSTLTFDSPIDLTTGVLNAARFSMALPAVCNTNSRLVLTTDNGGLRRDSVSLANTNQPSPFATRIDYHAFVSWQSAPAAELTTNGSEQVLPMNGAATGPRSGDLTLEFSLLQSGDALVAAGAYSDVLRLTIEPQ